MSYRKKHNRPQYFDYNKRHGDSKNMRIELTENDIYLAGQYVQGTLFVNLGTEVPNAECSIKLFCLAEVGWTDNPGIRDEGRSFHVQHKLLEMIYDLGALNSARGGDFFPMGPHEVTFEFLLPDNLDLPSSFQSRFGSIQYYIEAKMGEDTKRRDILVDMPINKNLWLAVGGTSEKDFGVLSFASGSISMQATLQKKGHYRGEEIQVHYTIDNSSTANVKPRVTFFQTQIYMTGERHKTVENSLSEAIEGEEVAAHTLVEDGVITVQIPVNVPLSIKSEFISCKYFVHCTLDIPMATDIHINLPVVVTSRSCLEN